MGNQVIDNLFDNKIELLIQLKSETGNSMQYLKQQKLDRLFNECDKHQKRMQSAYVKISSKYL